jgi:hypothetical protein
MLVVEQGRGQKKKVQSPASRVQRKQRLRGLGTWNLELGTFISCVRESNGWMEIRQGERQDNQVSGYRCVGVSVRKYLLRSEI